MDGWRNHGNEAAFLNFFGVVGCVRSLGLTRVTPGGVHQSGVQAKASAIKANQNGI